MDEPGPELDALVAEKVMGDRTYGRPNLSGQERLQRSLNDHGYSINQSWSPSTSIVDAWEVVEKLNEDGGCYSLINDDNGHWVLVSDGMQPVQEKFSGGTTFIILEEDVDLWADTAPLAICLAALRAVKG